MSEDVNLDRTSVLFTALNEMADAIELVAYDYPDQIIEAKVTPIRNPEEGTNALAQVIIRMEGRWNDITQKDQQKVAGRYVGLGQAGTSSLVKLTIPGGAQRFDWKTFYDQVGVYE